MTTLLQINTSLFSEGGQSSQLADAFVATWQEKHANTLVVKRDLAAAPVPHLDAARFAAFLAKPEDRTPAQAEFVAYSDQLIAELREADVIVLGLPMYNFGIPSTLKAYFDHVARAGETFHYTATGPVGHLGGKKVYVFSARGGVYSGTPKDTETDYIRIFFGFLGITDIEFVYAEGLSMGDDKKSAALSKARAEVAQLAA